jgi:hypothetical protein
MVAFQPGRTFMRKLLLGLTFAVAVALLSPASAAPVGKHDPGMIDVAKDDFLEVKGGRGRVGGWGRGGALVPRLEPGTQSRLARTRLPSGRLATGPLLTEFREAASVGGLFHLMSLSDVGLWMLDRCLVRRMPSQRSLPTRCIGQPGYVAHLDLCGDWARVFVVPV